MKFGSVIPGDQAENQSEGYCRDLMIFVETDLWAHLAKVPTKYPTNPPSPPPPQSAAAAVRHIAFPGPPQASRGGELCRRIKRRSRSCSDRVDVRVRNPVWPTSALSSSKIKVH